jgi:TetR/AcrR family transcriptional repressor of lmrAB and yxaGH operons
MKVAHEPSSRERILSTTASLLQDQGYHATGLNQIISVSDSPKGSLYYYFPGGKEELVAEAVRMSAAATLESLNACLNGSDKVLEGLTRFLEGSIQLLQSSDFKKGCPIATVGLETAHISAPIRKVCSEFFVSVEKRLAQRLEQDGYLPQSAAAFANLIFCGFEGAMITSRVRRDVAPLRTYQQSISALLTAQTFKAKA